MLIQLILVFVYCSDFSGLLSYILEIRELPEDFHLKIGIESGGGSLKVCLNVLPENDPEYVKKYKSAGINKLFIIGLGPKLSESYANIKSLFEALDLQSICGICSYTFAADFKLIMILLGLQSNSSTHTCPWCDVNVKEMEIKGSFRTIKSITENTNLWQQSGGNITKAKDFKNCINIPLIIGDVETPVLRYIPPPELHLLLGVVQKLFDCLELENINVATEWIKKKRD
ncbi:uncharacterized protein LOC115876459 [Sitophilus oryzae]|uniref:Uncharacterized protein LOC115876459 n=1 Tax=Sitophilus oryzae TaxID=7048 RepID=A0A6J2XAA3_SITOR|nr:uncharacterized protein LOC115876459 [Sitophilus oryzae]